MSTYVLPSVAFNAAPLRRHIIVCYWLVLLLAVPLWWVATSIERLALPDVRTPELRFPVHVLVEGNELSKQVSAALEWEKRNNPTVWRGLDLVVANAEDLQQPERGFTYRVKLHTPSSTDKKPLSISGRTLQVHTSQDPSSPELHKKIASALAGLIAPPISRAHLVARYAPTYRLAFSLLNEDASAGDAALRWDIQNGIQRFLSASLAQLGILHNFTIESQMQFHAPLAFVPPQDENGEYLLGEEELKIFINSAEWTLASSISEDPVLHFILFVPSATRRPLKVYPPTGSNAFLVPQWGGVVILSPQPSNLPYLTDSSLAQPLRIFRTHLLSLLGASALPPGISVSPPSSGLSTWQLDTLLRRRALENIHDSTEVLTSISKLVAQISNMPVGQGVRDDVFGALDAISQANKSAGPDALLHSARANGLSSRAFFNPGMLALLYFPAEHKYAVYIPLFAPVSVPLIAAAVREYRKWRKERQEARNQMELREKVD